MNKAEFKLRIIAKLIDVFIVILSLFFIFQIGGGLAMAFQKEHQYFRFFKAISIMEYALFFIIIYMLYSVIFESVWKSATPGKIITQLKVVTLENGSPHLSTIVKRVFLQLLFTLFPLSYFIALFNSSHILWHDKFSGTRVVGDYSTEMK